jgi:hypothetical protein
MRELYFLGCSKVGVTMRSAILQQAWGGKVEQFEQSFSRMR